MLREVLNCLDSFKYFLTKLLFLKMQFSNVRRVLKVAASAGTTLPGKSTILFTNHEESSKAFRREKHGKCF